MAEKELEYYNKNKHVLTKKFNKKFIVINNTAIVGVYKSEKEAFFGILKSEKMGTFLLQYCLPKQDDNNLYSIFSQIFQKSKEE
jgi:hypothetical protein